MAVVIADISADTGEIYDAVDGGTTAVTSMLGKARLKVVAITGTTTGYELCTRPLADAHVCQQVMGGLDPVSKSIGPLSVGEKKIRQMRDGFIAEYRENMRIKGFTSDGVTAKAQQVND